MIESYYINDIKCINLNQLSNYHFALKAGPGPATLSRADSPETPPAARMRKDLHWKWNFGEPHISIISIVSTIYILGIHCLWFVMWVKQ
jgi:hypothetical protein